MELQNAGREVNRVICRIFRPTELSLTRQSFQTSQF